MGRQDDVTGKDRVLAIPFGRYDGDGPVEPPGDQILVGRRAQRGYLVQQLLSLGRKGAYLVTGHRGAGKTSFVHQCVADYRSSVHERFLRSPVGRSIFWDRLVVLLLFAVVIFVALLLSESLEFLLGLGKTPQAPALLLAIPIVLLGFLPLLYAGGVLFVSLRYLWFVWVFGPRERRAKKSRGASPRRTGSSPVAREVADRVPPRGLYLWLVALVSGLLAMIWGWGSFGNPSLGMARTLVGVAWVYLGGTALLSFRQRVPHHPDPAPDEEPPQGSRSQKFFELLATFTVLLGGILFSVLGPELWFTDRVEPGPLRFWNDVRVALFLFLLGLTIRSLRAHTANQTTRARSPLGKSVRTAANSYLFTGVGLVLGWLLFEAAVSHEFSWQTLASVLPAVILGLLACLVALALGVLRHLTLRSGPLEPTSPRLKPTPNVIVFMKAFVGLVVFAQLLFPAVVYGGQQIPLLFGEQPEEQASPSAGKQPASPGETLSALSLALLNREWDDARSLRNTLASELEETDETTGKRLAALKASLDDLSSPRPASLEEARAKVDAGGVSTLFEDRGDEIQWLIGLLAVILLIFFIEYEWIVRPYARHRSGDRRPDRGTGSRLSVPPRQEHMAMVEQTLPWLLQHLWLPVLEVPVNLGFDKLGHQRVIQAMLAALRDRYHRTFLAWNSPLAVAGRLVLFLLVLMLTTVVGNAFFGAPIGDEQRAATCAELDTGPVQDFFCAAGIGDCGPHPVQQLLCQWGAPSLVAGLEFDLLSSGSGTYRAYAALRQDHLLHHLLPSDSEAGAYFIYFKVYHLILFVLIFLLARFVLKRLPIFPYALVQREIDSVLDQLTSRQGSRTSRSGWKLARWLGPLAEPDTIREKHTEPADPRVVELAFLRILQDMQESSFQLPGGHHHRVSLPAPDLIFIFDELDKVGTRHLTADQPAGTGDEHHILRTERRRSYAVHELLADLKNVLSSAPARFIFVGGRNLHDEWLADQTARRPLLTNVFNAEVYLPSLLTDTHAGPEGSGGRVGWSARIEEYLAALELRANFSYVRTWTKRLLPWHALPLEQTGPPTYVLDEQAVASSDSRPPQALVLDCGTGKPVPPEEAGRLKRDFVRFLTYRSLGNPKRLRDLVWRFQRPVHSVAAHDVRWRAFDCDDVLRFNDRERFRIQLLGSVYRSLAAGLETRLANRDDKLTTSVFYLSDFMFKFHRQAFAWANVERVDELVDVHRAPDLRSVVEEIIGRWSEELLHPILNGMYDFRFRSDLAAEIGYISRQSEEERAAFNFTLDESQALKTLYHATLERMGETATSDIIAALGELYDFDQEFETARHYYSQAIEKLDEEFTRHFESRRPGPSESRAVARALRGEDRGPDDVRRHITWGVERLRLTLQVGMTYERERNHERAAATYRNARTLARRVIAALLGADGDENPRRDLWARLSNVGGTEQHRFHPSRRRLRLQLLKHLHVVFQPLFAEAWVAEKMESAVDTSTTLVEQELWRLRRELPFLRPTDDERPLADTDAMNVRHTNFALVAAELHNKAGDLYFFKGRQVLRTRTEDQRARLKEWAERGRSPHAEERQSQGGEGYLLKAHYHYCVGLHEVRRFAARRRECSPYKLNPLTPEGEHEHTSWETIEQDGLPDYVFRTAGSNLNDMAEAGYARVSLLGLFADLRERLDDGSIENGDVERDAAQLALEMTGRVRHWLQTSDEREDPDERSADDAIRVSLAGTSLELGSISGWLGEWTSGQQKDPRGELRPVKFEGRDAHHNDLQRLILSLGSCLAGARLLEDGGYLEDAGRELLQVADTANRLLWWWRTIEVIVRTSKGVSDAKPDASDPEPDDPLKTWFDRLHWPGLFQKATGGAPSPGTQGVFYLLAGVASHALERADRLFRRSRSKHGPQAVDCDPKDDALVIGDVIPVRSVSLAAGLGLVAHSRDWPRISSAMRKLLERWKAPTRSRAPGTGQAFFRDILEANLQQHSFPMLNRLHVLKLLIDDTALHGSATGVSDEALLGWADQLARGCELLQAPLHFTPQLTGSTFALLWFHLPSKTRREQTWIRRLALERLSRSEEMYSQRRGYYSTVRELYYLYDDFNDRQIHFNHALQMAGSEVNSLLKESLTKSERHHPEGDGPMQWRL
ncbi:MAG: hypothetical protein ACQEXJ_05810 [Myxococcota bacterium]